MNYLGWDGLRIGHKVSNGSRRTPSLEVNGSLYPMYEAAIPCPGCGSRSLDGHVCGVKSQCMEANCGQLFGWHDFACYCMAHDREGQKTSARGPARARAEGTHEG